MKAKRLDAGIPGRRKFENPSCSVRLPCEVRKCYSRGCNRKKVETESVILFENGTLSNQESKASLNCGKSCTFCKEGRKPKSLASKPVLQIHKFSGVIRPYVPPPAHIVDLGVNLEIFVLSKIVIFRYWKSCDVIHAFRGIRIA